MKIFTTIDRALALYNMAADRAAEDAGWSGALNDGGCKEMKARINSYICGREGKIPDWLEPYIKEAKSQEDPEYLEYQRLKAKFEK